MKKVTAKPIRDQVIVKRHEVKEEKTEGGLYIPGTATEKPSTGEVIAVGSGKLTSTGTSIPLEVSVGDTVAFNKHAGIVLKVGTEEMLVLHEEQLLCVLTTEV